MSNPPSPKIWLIFSCYSLLWCILKAFQSKRLHFFLKRFLEILYFWMTHAFFDVLSIKVYFYRTEVVKFVIVAQCEGWYSQVRKSFVSNGFPASFNIFWRSKETSPLSNVTIFRNSKYRVYQKACNIIVRA